MEPPYSFEPGALYVIQVLEGGRWVTKSRGKPTLRRMQNFLKIMDKADTCRVRKRLPNGVWFGACMASDHYAFVKAAVKYLKECKINKVKPKASVHSFGRQG